MRFPKAKFTIIAAIVAVSTVGVFGQDVSITKTQFENIMTNSYKAAAFSPVRQTVEIEELVNGVVSPERTRREIYEAIPPNRTRKVNITIRSGKEDSWELIEIGSKSWHRKNDGAWARDDISGCFPGTSAVVTSESYMSKGKSMLTGHETSVYEKIERLTTTKNDVIVDEEVVTTTVWIDKKGLRLKVVTETENLKTRNISRSTETNEYNPKGLKIEAPIK